MSFQDLGLAPEILRAIADQGYTEPTPIQAQAIPAILQGHDVMAGAQTGTGKTAGFMLPILQRLKPHANSSASPARHPVRALVLAPTRELAAQVHESAKTYGKHLALRSAVVFGGVSIDPQLKELKAGVEILVATPGRLLDHVQQKSVNLSQVEVLVLDEADRMLDMGFLPDIKRILALLPGKRQNLLFSATFAEEIKRLADQLLNAPVLIEAARRNAVAEMITHHVHRVETARKVALLSYLIKSQDLRQVLVFTRTKQSADRLARELERDGINAVALHGDKSQPERMQSLEDFKQGKVRVLVATDIAARGLDIEQLPHVVNYELPPNPEDYVHRIGRTGRAGASGDAISLVSSDETELLASIERLLKTKITVESVPGFEASTATASRSRDKPHSPRPRSSPPPAMPAADTAMPPEPASAAPVKASTHAKPQPKKKSVPALFLPPKEGQNH